MSHTLILSPYNKAINDKKIAVLVRLDNLNYFTLSKFLFLMRKFGLIDFRILPLIE